MIDISVKKGLRDFVLDVDIQMPEGGTLVLLGENGAGKSSILNLVGGLMTPDTGHIRIGGETFVDTATRTCIPAESRGTGFVFQDYALFPHMTVAENIAYGLRIRHLPREEIEARIRELAGSLDLLGVCDEMVGSLSGGQRQRVALLRALAVEPKCLLLDEPFSALDIRTQVQMRQELKTLLAGAKIPVILVTHDLRDAIALGDRICLMEKGRIVLCGDADAILHEGKHPFIDQYFSAGSP
ncbi:ABC transporter ATP-binding protein [uncultured Methanoregula sp.]|uniref:ABC transporter ATP-binding protein n=1 Tax=uncultured Methanoregula sp. TaxID=1005933 RepID=UPI002AAAB70F|nr:ABC transporter ATP-binding protein [uncultured Methanoregula sp.]